METTVIAAGPLDIPVMPGEPENRYCSHCGHHGDDNDAATETACCLRCEQAQPYPCDDHCAHCGEDGAMGMACPECNGPYRLDDNYAQRRLNATPVRAVAVEGTVRHGG